MNRKAMFPSHVQRACIAILWSTALALCAGGAMAAQSPQDQNARQSSAQGAAKQPADDASQLGPQQLVEKVARDTLEDLDANREEYRKSPSKIRELVDKVMLPYFDTRYAAQLVLAKHWRDASPQQRERFIEAFYQSLLQNYGEALLEFTPDRLRILPYQGKPDAKVATVRTEVRRDNGSRVPVNYSLRKTPEGWKAYDVQIEGVSYVKSFRTDFGSEIQQKGLESVIQRLESQIASGTVQKPTATDAPSR